MKLTMLIIVGLITAGCAGQKATLVCESLISDFDPEFERVYEDNAIKIDGQMEIYKEFCK